MILLMGLSEFVGHAGNQGAQGSDFPGMDDLFLSRLEFFSHSVEGQDQMVHFAFDPLRMLNGAEIATADLGRRLFEKRERLDDLSVDQNRAQGKQDQDQAR